jgi:hypothetical protein
LKSSDFRTREEATERLMKLGAAVLPALRKAAMEDKLEVEARRRIEAVADKIVDGILGREEKLWKELDAPRRGIKDRIVRVLAKTPALSDAQTTTAIYLLCVGRPPTEDEAAQAAKQFAAIDGRTVNILRLTRSLVNGMEYRAEVAEANERLVKLRKDVAGEENGIRLLNGQEVNQLTRQVAASLGKATKSDEHFIQVASLVMLSRFPGDDLQKTALDHLKKGKNRTQQIEDVIWAVINTKEFLVAP